MVVARVSDRNLTKKFFSFSSHGIVSKSCFREAESAVDAEFVLLVITDINIPTLPIWWFYSHSHQYIN